jgi:hypothetical protein
LMPEASTRMSTPPNRFTAASTILSQFAAEFGRRFHGFGLGASPSHSARDGLERIGAAGGAPGYSRHRRAPWRRAPRTRRWRQSRLRSCRAHRTGRVDSSEFFGHDRLTKQGGTSRPSLAGLVPAIHVFLTQPTRRAMGHDKRGRDGVLLQTRRSLRHRAAATAIVQTSFPRFDDLSVTRSGQ